MLYSTWRRVKTGLSNLPELFADTEQERPCGSVQGSRDWRMRDKMVVPREWHLPRGL